MRRRLAAIGAGMALLVGVPACAQQQPADPVTPQVDLSVPDCDAEDKRKKEVPDCGFRHKGRFHAWSWVKAGHQQPPADWGLDDADKERRAVTDRR